MKSKIFYLIATLCCLFLTACKKEGLTSSGTSSLNIINASIAVPNLALNFSQVNFPYYQDQTSISYGSVTEFGLLPSTNWLNLVSSADTLKPLFHGKLNLQLGGIYSFYVIGNTAPIDTLFLEDHIPIYRDSSAGVRFVNLSPDAGPVTISQQGSSQSVTSNLSYKAITAFEKYAATSNVTNNGGYNFNITNSSGTVLTTFNWNPTLQRNNTLVISGSNVAGNMMVFEVNNY